MTIFDDIRKDRDEEEADWIFDEINVGKSGEWAWQLRTDYGGIPVFVDCSNRFNRDRTFEDFARRIARVPRLERIALAAEELAKLAVEMEAMHPAISAWCEAITGSKPDGFIESVHNGSRALAAFRAACGEG